MRETLERGRNTYSPALLTLLESRLEQCQNSLDKLQKGLAALAPPLAQTHETLVSILRSTSAVNTRSKVANFNPPPSFYLYIFGSCYAKFLSCNKFSATEVNSLRDQLKKIESQMKDGNFVDSEGNILPGQDDIKSLMERCWRWTEIVLERYVSCPR